MSRRHRFDVDFYNVPHQKHFISNEDADQLKTELLSRRKPLVYIRHLYWLQFKEHEKPIYINMVRDPVELFISNFYYLRKGFSKKNNTNSEWKWEMSNDRRELTIESCIEKKGFLCGLTLSNRDFRAGMRGAVCTNDSLFLWPGREMSPETALEMGPRACKEKRSE